MFALSSHIKSRHCLYVYRSCFSHSFSVQFSLGKHFTSYFFCHSLEDWVWGSLITLCISSLAFSRILSENWYGTPHFLRFSSCSFSHCLWRLGMVSRNILYSSPSYFFSPPFSRLGKERFSLYILSFCSFSPSLSRLAVSGDTLRIHFYFFFHIH